MPEYKTRRLIERIFNVNVGGINDRNSMMLIQNSFRPIEPEQPDTATARQSIDNQSGMMQSDMQRIEGRNLR